MNSPSSQDNDNTVESSAAIIDHHFSIAGIGASAGGLEAISDLLENLSPKLKIAYVIIQHLDPNHESILPELLQRKTKMPVHAAGDKMKVEANHVYVIPPNKYIVLVDGHIKLNARNSVPEPFHSIDYFLSSLAEIYKQQAIGIILSGTATDGTLGLKAIKAEGGVTFAQDESARFQGMPQNVINAGFADFILSPKEIAAELKEISAHPYLSKGLSGEAEPNEADENKIKKILLILNHKIKADFNYYKKSTIQRRIMRRMALNGIKDLNDYINLLRSQDTNEAEQLYHDLLINVTSFFREPFLYNHLKENVIPEIIKRNKGKEPIRVWIAGCATGEEAYSVAISFAEVLEHMKVKPTVQIFATDLSEKAIEKARRGMYIKSTVQNISSKREEKFFTQVDGQLQVKKFIRDICVFAVHDLLKDPPFSRMDLVSCQNVLIYLAAEAQKKLIQTFHYSLKNDAYLLLGKSEAMSKSPELFSQVEKKLKIFVKLKSDATPTYDFSSPVSITPVSKKQTLTSEEQLPVDPEKKMDKLLLDEYVRASMLVNSNMEIVCFRGAMAPYLEPDPGKLNPQVLKMVKDSLAFVLVGLIKRCRKEGKKLKRKGLKLLLNDKLKEITIEVTPIKESAKSTFFLVVFIEAPLIIGQDNSSEISETEYVSEDHLTDVEQELNESREQIKHLSEEYEAMREEMQSANEEVLSSNEELQSLNEELETSKEELQSSNEELVTINEELQHKNDDFKEARDYAEAIVETVSQPLIILNDDLRIYTANEAFYKKFHVKHADTEGHFLNEIGNRQWDIPLLREKLYHIHSLHNELHAFEVTHEFPDIGRKVMMLNAKALKQRNNKSFKILLAIEDVTERQQMEQQKDDFIAIASHELKTPLTSINLYNQLLQESLKDLLDENGLKMMRSMNGQVNHLILLINDLLDISKIKSNNLQMQKEDFDINEIISEIVDEKQLIYRTHSLVKELKAPIKVHADKKRISQVLTNFISNAVKYSPEANKIIIATKKEEGNLVVSVKDFGIGISKAMQGKIFNRFARINETAKGFPGIGLGLYISANIIKEHKGTIGLESEQGKGSIFYFSLPLKEK